LQSLQEQPKGKKRGKRKGKGSLFHALRGVSLVESNAFVREGKQGRGKKKRGKEGEGCPPKTSTLQRVVKRGKKKGEEKKKEKRVECD